PTTIRQTIGNAGAGAVQSRSESDANDDLAFNSDDGAESEIPIDTSHLPDTIGSLPPPDLGPMDGGVKDGSGVVAGIDDAGFDVNASSKTKFADEQLA